RGAWEGQTQDSEMNDFGKSHLARYLAARVTRDYDNKRVAYLDMVGKIHTPKAGSAELDVPLVQMTALMGFVSDALIGTSMSSGLDKNLEQRMVRAFNTLLWPQNDMITRQSQALPSCVGVDT